MVKNGKKFAKFLEKLCDSYNIKCWQDISKFLDKIGDTTYKYTLSKSSTNIPFKNIAFITFDYGIDGVSIEIAKYAISLEKLFKNKYGLDINLHFIGGDFHDKADTILRRDCKRFRIPNANGWNKWYNGKYFSNLFYQDMPEGSKESREMALEICYQSINFAKKLGTYIEDNNINLIMPVNICSNPGNPAIAIATIIVSELLNLYVINSNHDFYWEGGKPNREPKESPGPRDHFFRNFNNRDFFKFFERIFPWNGKRWLQVNINRQQSKTVIDKFNFSPKKVFEIGSCISDKFLEEYTIDDKILARKKMAIILSNRSLNIRSVNIAEHIENISNWMKNQKPILCSYESKEIDIANTKTVYMLQPTRIIGRKRIYKDMELINALFNSHAFKNKFKEDKELQLVIHITGPVPIEHQKDLEIVLKSYWDTLKSIDVEIARRFYLAFSVGTEDHPNLRKFNLSKLSIEEIYRVADIVLFPSETEGRGLPIIESAASGIPIVCSRYYPREVFDEVVGKNLEDSKQIKYLPFPEGSIYPEQLLKDIYDFIFNKEKKIAFLEDNREAVKMRYSIENIIDKFKLFIDMLIEIDN